MKIVIPLAGFGKRLRPHTFTKPKPLVIVAGKPVLGHVLDMFEKLDNVDEIIFIVGHLGEQIEEYVAQNYPRLKARYFEQKELNGQSTAIYLAREHLHGPMLMVFVDTLVKTDLAALKHEMADAVTWVKAVEDPRRFGVAEVGPRRAGLFIHLMPVFGTLLAIAFLGETLRLYHGAGIALIVAGIVLATRERAQFAR